MSDGVVGMRRLPHAGTAHNGDERPSRSTVTGLNNSGECPCVWFPAVVQTKGCCGLLSLVLPATLFSRFRELTGHRHVDGGHPRHLACDGELAAQDGQAETQQDAEDAR